ncbi:MAG TPA: protein kinase, partial [Thermoanaerobaculia bacterium]
GAEASGGREYIVMELVPGETLSEILARGPLPLAEALRFALQIAEALEAAHEEGVVHRDLKPSNIKVTPGGKVKVLDLGLAKAMQPSSPDATASQSPTLIADQTRPGVILGTVEYMSPEQARGKEVDKRADIWAFGCVLFEMLSGRRAFTGETTSDALVSILTREPDWPALPSETPERIRELVRRCLQKDAGQRVRDAGDARLEIESCLAELSGRSGPRDAARPPRPVRRWAPLVLILLVLAAGTAAWLYSRGSRSTSGAAADRMRSLVVLPSRDLSGTPGGQLVGDGLVETLSARLGELPGIQVVTPSAAVAASDRLADPFRAAKSVGATLAVRSSLMRSGDVVRIAYSIWDVGNRSQLASGTVDGAASDLFGIQDRLAESVAGGLKVRRGARRTPTPTGLDGAGAQERYLQAIGNLQRYDKPAEVDAAVRTLETLAAEKPNSALVPAALGRAYLYEYNLTREKSWTQKAAGAVARARQLDPDLPEVNATLGELESRTGKPKEAIAAFERTLAV